MPETVKDPGSSETGRVAPGPKRLIYPEASSLSSGLLVKGWTLLGDSGSFSRSGPKREVSIHIRAQSSHPKVTPAAPQFLIRMVSP